METFSLTEIFAPVQLLAWVAAVLFMLSYQWQTANKTIATWIPADLLMTLHFYFMGAPLFTLIAAGGFFRSIIAVKFSRKILIAYLCGYLAIVYTASPFMGEGVKDIMAVIGTSFFSLSTIMKHNFLLHRGFAFVHQICWIFAFIMLGSYGGLVLIISLFVSNIIGTGRYVLGQKRDRAQAGKAVS